jgi:hypothetical protein
MNAAMLADRLVEPQKLARAPFDPASKAEKILRLGVHEKRRSPVLVKWATPRIAAPALRKRDAGADDRDDVIVGRHGFHYPPYGQTRSPLAQNSTMFGA